jgi:hypothetical protein
MPAIGAWPSSSEKPSADTIKRRWNVHCKVELPRGLTTSPRVRAVSQHATSAPPLRTFFWDGTAKSAALPLSEVQEEAENESAIPVEMP